MYNWDELTTEVEETGYYRIALLILEDENYKLILESEYNGFNCFTPSKLLLMNCSPAKSVLSEELLRIISISDRIEYKRECVFIEFDVKYITEVKELYAEITEKLHGRRHTTITIIDHVLLDKEDNDYV